MAFCAKVKMGNTAQCSFKNMTLLLDLSATLQNIPPPSSEALLPAATSSDQPIDPQSSRSAASLWSGPGQLLEWVIVISLCLDQSTAMRVGPGRPLGIHVDGGDLVWPPDTLFFSCVHTSMLAKFFVLFCRKYQKGWAINMAVLPPKTQAYASKSVSDGALTLGPLAPCTHH